MSRVGEAMQSAFASAGLTARYWLLAVTPQGAHTIV